MTNHRSDPRSYGGFRVTLQPTIGPTFRVATPDDEEWVTTPDWDEEEEK